MKQIRIDVAMGGKRVSTLQELREFASEELLALFEDGRLRKWLHSRGLEDECACLDLIGTHEGPSQTLKRLYEALGVTRAVDEAALLRWLAETAFAEAETYEKGAGEKADMRREFELYLKAADLGHAAAQVRLGVICEVDAMGAEKAAVSYIADLDAVAPAQGNLTLFTPKGTGVVRVPEETLRWYLKAVAQKHAEAQCCLGWCYHMGIGIANDLVKAVEWYRKAAEQGNARAQANLAWCYQMGQGVPADSTEAVVWYRKAADQGYAMAQSNLGACYEYGTGVRQNVTEAANWYRKAADQAFAVAEANYASCLQNGIGVRKNELDSVGWYRKSAAQGYARAQNWMGYFYTKGIGSLKDLQHARTWFQMAAEQGYALAQYNLGRCYALGDGVEKNRGLAKEWYQRAADQGNADAKAKLRNMR